MDSTVDMKIVEAGFLMCRELQNPLFLGFLIEFTAWMGLGCIGAGLAAGAPLRAVRGGRAHQRAGPGPLHRQGLARQRLHAGVGCV